MVAFGGLSAIFLLTFRLRVFGVGNNKISSISIYDSYCKSGQEKILIFLRQSFFGLKVYPP